MELLKTEICRELRSQLLPTAAGHLLMLGLVWVAFQDTPPNLSLTLILVIASLARLVLFLNPSLECSWKWRTIFSSIIFFSVISWSSLVILLVKNSENTLEFAAIVIGVLLGLNSAALFNLSTSAHDFYFFQSVMHLTAMVAVEDLFVHSRQKAVAIILLIMSFVYFSLQRQFRYKEWTRLIMKTKMSSLGEMSGNMAHEINNILSVSLVRLSKLEKLIEKGDFNQIEYGRLVGVVKKSSLRMGKILRGILNLSRRSAAEPKKFETIKSILEETIPFCESRFANQNVRLKVPVIPESCRVECNFVEISQVLVNLLNNAYDAALLSAGEKWVEIQLEETPNDFFLKVLDSGPGFSKLINEKNWTTKSIESGSGLGLRVSRLIIQSHQGRLYFDKNSPFTCAVIQLSKSQSQVNPNK